MIYHRIEKSVRMASLVAPRTAASGVSHLQGKRPWTPIVYGANMPAAVY